MEKSECDDKMCALLSDTKTYKKKKKNSMKIPWPIQKKKMVTILRKLKKDGKTDLADILGPIDSMSRPAIRLKCASCGHSL